jgi:hypothetical protein
MARSEHAFDETRCPYREGEVREVREGLSVQEELRACQDGVEERRWILDRDGRTLELGRRRLEARLFEGYTWTAAEDAEGRVRIEIRQPGHDQVRVFREPARDAGVATP